ncbi:MAG: hypothetical protein A2512_03180 [Deltaproteobacteria bacterium RIFOXYD12_FULL_56_24]|nr:MAG: hypothetical protein A2512_03180 [Deltaproteobacteria bacterium RIFOXYD12_FULL_56_24]
MMHPQATEQRSLPVKFFEVLEQEVILSQDMLSILHEEQKALVSMDMQALLRLSASKENRLSRIQAMDSLLANLTSEIRPKTSGKAASLAALLPLLNREDGSKLAQYRKILTRLREEILKRNLINRHFAADVKTYLNDAISLITSGIAERPMYGLTGLSRKPSLNQPSFISREV